MKHVLFIGDAKHGEFQSVVTWLQEYCHWAALDTPDLAVEWRRQQTYFPDVVVLAEARPGMFQQAAIKLLQDSFPNSRLVGLLGGWCEGELRTGTPWQGISRFYWHQFLSRMTCELTATSQPSVAGGVVAIRASSSKAYQAIADACVAIGFDAVWSHSRGLASTSSALAGLWDCQHSVTREAADLADFVRSLHPAPIIALLGFPRREDESAALAAGATAVVSKPYLLDDLRACVSQVARCQHGSA